MAGISISIKAGATAATSAVQASGSVVHIITPTERNTFGIDDAALKAAVGKYFGQPPDDAFLCEPTPWGGLYNTYHWTQVQMSLVVQKAEILSITSEPIIIATKDFANNSPYPANFNCAISDDVSNTTETNWSETNTIDVNQTISYEVSFLGTGGGGSTSIDYSYAWGKGGSESTTVTVGSTAGVSVDLAPGQKVQAKLTASRGTMKVRVSYLASVAGTVAINYGGTYKGHHFWGLDLGNVTGAAGLSTNHVLYEDIEVGYYANGKVELVNPDGGLLRAVALLRPDLAVNAPDHLAAQALSAKQGTVDALKAFEAGKAQASASLTAKLDGFNAGLSDAERDEMSALLQPPATVLSQPAAGADVAYLKPMQRAEAVGGDSVFLKPMQRADVNEAAV